MRTAFDAQPIPRPSSRRATNKTEQVKQERLLNLSDAAVVVQWLNAAKDARATASYKQVTNIRQQLAELRTLRERLKECGPDPQEDAAAWREYEVQKAKLKPGHKSEPVTFPAYRNPRLDLKLRGQINRSCSSLNEALKKYAFRPQVAQLACLDSAFYKTFGPAEWFLTATSGGSR